MARGDRICCCGKGILGEQNSCLCFAVRSLKISIVTYINIVVQSSNGYI